jgi:hypothetical protein
MSLEHLKNLSNEFLLLYSIAGKNSIKGVLKYDFLQTLERHPFTHSFLNVNLLSELISHYCKTKDLFFTKREKELSSLVDKYYKMVRKESLLNSI